VYVVASHNPDEGRSAGDGGNCDERLSSAPFGTDHPEHTRTRAKLQDSYIYYAELLVAVDGRSLPVQPPRIAPDGRDQDPRFGDTWT
jgi:hypothetical protein